jgi:hypothetical protein
MSQGETEQAPGTAGQSSARTLFAVLGGAIAWSVHFVGSYALLAAGCVARWSGIPGLVLAATGLLGAVALWSTVVAYREWVRSSSGQRWDSSLSEPRGWYAWLMTVGVLMGITSIFAIVLEGLSSLFLPVCGWDVR